MALAGGGQWEVTAVAPSFFHGDLRPIPLEPSPGEACHVEALPVRLSKFIHVMHYGIYLRDILQRDWDIVHCWEEPYIVVGGQVAWWTPQYTPLVFATFQNITKSYPIPFNWIERYCLKRASGWIAFGHTSEDTLGQQSHYSARTCRLIPLGVDTSHFRPDPESGRRVRQHLGWTGDRPLVIGYIGRFVPEKGLRLLIKVLDRLRVPWRALFIGGGPMTEQLQEWAARHGDRVKIVTGVSHDQVPAYLNAMDVLCAPSQTTRRWHEQFGRMLVEAFACGVPVIASDSGEIPYVVREAGVIVGEKDEDVWLQALTQLLEDAPLRAELAAMGVERAHRLYAWPVVARQHLIFFEELLAARQPCNDHAQALAAQEN